VFIKIVRFLVHHLPEGVSYALIELLASIPTTPPLKDSDRRILSGATKIRFGKKEKKAAWIWGTGPLVVFVHGWSGRSGQMAALAQHISERGFRTVVFDVTAHGESKGLCVTFRDFISDVAELSEALDGPVFAYVAHSAGGLGMMAARELKGIRAERYICLCAPRAPYVPIHDIRKILGPPEAVLDRFKKYYSSHFESTWEELDRGRAFTPSDHGSLFLVYDEDDDRVEHTDGERIQAIWPTSKLLKTRGLGHQKVLRDRQVMEQVTGFLQDE
jgi:pimeloyl-ACP methyl ester carboxylesterase